MIDNRYCRSKREKSFTDGSILSVFCMTDSLRIDPSIHRRLCPALVMSSKLADDEITLKHAVNLYLVNLFYSHSHHLVAISTCWVTEEPAWSR
jgi:hypothetical protein